jgi:hypothetical protein
VRGDLLSRVRGLPQQRKVGSQQRVTRSRAGVIERRQQRRAPLGAAAHDQHPIPAPGNRWRPGTW